MKTSLIAYVSAVVAFLVIDGVWLGLIAKRFYAEQLGDLMRDPILVWPAATFYLAYAGGLVFLAVRPLQPEISLGNVALVGAVVGAMSYGTYDMTNLSTVAGWPMTMAFVDVVWGTCLSAAVAVIAALAVRQFA